MTVDAISQLYAEASKEHDEYVRSLGLTLYQYCKLIHMTDYVKGLKQQLMILESPETYGAADATS